MTEQRSQLFVKHEFQKNIILEVLLVTFIMINIVVVAGFVLLDRIPNLHQNREYIALAIAVFEIVGFFAVYRYNVKSSHRIAGPIFNLERSLKSIKTGDLGFTMKMRDKDHFQELGGQMNDAVSSLRQRIGKAQVLARSLQQQGGQDTQTINALVAELDYFKTDELLTTQPVAEAPPIAKAA